jgi:predicted ATPase
MSRALANRAAESGELTGWLARLQEHVAQTKRETARTPTDQRHVIVEYTKVLHAFAAARPLLLWLDDLQWADASSLSLLFYLIRHLTGSRILVIGSYRPEDVAAGRGAEPHPFGEMIAEFQRQYGRIRLDLDSAGAEGRHFVDALLDSEPNQLDEGFRQALFRHSGGQALFTVELLRELQERGDLLKDSAGRWSVGQDLDWSIMPPRVEGVIAKRLRRLSPDLRDILTVASVEGEEFTAGVVSRVRALDEREVVRRLGSELDRQHRLVRAQELRPLGGRRLFIYRFRHHLFQAYLYQNLAPTERAFLHAAVGEALEELYAGQQEQLALMAAQLARHFQEAGVVDKASEYRLLAGQQAVSVSANQEAVRHLETGLALLRELPDTPERARRELAFQIALGVPVTALKGYSHPDVETVYARARTLSVQLHDARQLFQALYGLWRMVTLQGALRSAQQLGDELMELAR